MKANRSLYAEEFVNKAKEDDAKKALKSAEDIASFVERKL